MKVDHMILCRLEGTLHMANEDQSIVYVCKYQVPGLMFATEDEKLVFDSSNVIRVEKQDDFDYNLRTVLKVTLRMEMRKKLWIMKHKRDIVCTFEMDKIAMDSEVEEFLSTPQKMWYDEFSIFLTDDDESIDIAAMEQRLGLDNDPELPIEAGDEDYQESENVLNIYLFQKKLLNASNKTVNAVFTRDNIQNMAAALLTETGHKRVLLSPMENTTIYEELLVPAFPCYKALMFLDQYFGFYRTGGMIYYDVDTLYILNTNGKCKAKQENEWDETVFIVTDGPRSLPGNAMVIRPQEKVNYCNIAESSLNVQNYAGTINEKYGSTAKIVVTDDTAINTAEADQDYIDQRNTAYAYITKEDNQFTADIMKARMEENQAYVCINANNLDIQAFTPNKSFKLVFDDVSKQEKYGKNLYRLAYAYHILALESGYFYSAKHRIVLKRCGTISD